MTPADDIKGLDSGGESEKTPDREKGHPAPAKSVGPESEVRGGPEAPEDDAQG